MAIKLPSGVSVSGLYSTLLDSNRANIKAKDKMALIEENQKPIQSAIKTTLDDNFSASYLGDYIKVAFEDERSGQLVSVNLSTKNAINLILNFKGENNFFLRSDGILRLNGEVQNFVSGWFDKVAYDMNLLGADSDKNGLVEGQELNDTFLYLAPYIYGNAKKAADITNYTFAGGDKLSYKDTELRGLDIVRVIDASLNALLNEDKNADNKISFLEHFGSLKMALGNVEMQVNDGSNAEFDMLEFILEQLKKMLQEMLEKMLENGISPESKATQQGLQALSATELELFKNQNPAEYERLKNEQAYTEFNDFNGESGLNDGGLNLNLDEINGGNLGLNSNVDLNSNKNLDLNLNETNSVNLGLNLNENSGVNSNVNLGKNSGELNKNSSVNLNETNEISGENSSLNLDKINSKNSSANLGKNNSELKENSSDEALSPTKQRALKLLQKALSQDLLTQIKSQNLKIIDLRA